MAVREPSWDKHLAMVARETYQRCPHPIGARAHGLFEIDRGDGTVRPTKERHEYCNRCEMVLDVRPSESWKYTKIERR